LSSKPYRQIMINKKASLRRLQYRQLAINNKYIIIK
jgi:hypothetical protein